MPTLTVNGKPRQIEREMTVPEFLAAHGIDRRLVAVAVNGEVIPRDRYDATVLREGDVVEVVRMVGGG
jgi:thiamine biosynthesis protein ThiS